MKFHIILLILASFLIRLEPAMAKVKWSEPEVVKEKLKRKNRRVMRFSGKTKPGALVRIRKNRLRLFMDSGTSRWAKIPQKNQVQFPVKADEDGIFSFDLYLPTIAVEIPIEVRDGSKWRPYTLNFRVPDSGKAKGFDAIEESFKEPTDDGMDQLDKSDNYYSRNQDRGMVLRDRDGKLTNEVSTVQAWAGLGFSYFNTSSQINGQGINMNASGSTLALPAFRFGLNWDYSKKVKLKVAVRNTSGSTDDIGSLNDGVIGNDFNWLEAQLGALWFSDLLAMKKGRLAFDFGVQLQKLPYFREREGFTQRLYIDNDTYNVHFGLAYLKENNPTWDYEGYARLLYPISSGDAFNVEGFPIMFEAGGGISRKISQGLSFGVYGQFEYFMMDVSYSNNGVPRDGSLDLMLFTMDARLMVNF